MILVDAKIGVKCVSLGVCAVTDPWHAADHKGAAR